MTELRDRIIGGPHGGQDVIVRSRLRSFWLFDEPKEPETIREVFDEDPVFEPKDHRYDRADVFSDGIKMVFWVHSSINPEDLFPMTDEIWKDIAKPSAWPAESCFVLS